MADDPLAPLRARFRDRCAEDAARLRAHLAGEEEAELEQLVHRLAGAAGTFGYTALGEAAQAADATFAAGERPSPEALADLADHLEQMTRPPSAAG